MRQVLSLGVLFGCVAMIAGQGAILPQTLGTAYLVNKTGKTIRFVISSERGVHSELVPDNSLAATYFQGQRTRVITVYEVGNPNAPPIVNEQIALESGVYYEIVSVMPLTTVAPGSPAPVNAAPRSTLRKLKTPPVGVKKLGTAPKIAP